MSIWKKAMPLSLFSIILGGCSHPEITPRTTSEIYLDGKFASKMDEQSMGFAETLKVIWKLFVSDTSNLEPKKGEIRVTDLSTKDLELMPNNSVVRLVHSTLLFKLNGRFLLTDPVFSSRASPVSFAGPKRFHKLPISIDQLPFIDHVILSHNHYDHFDKPSLTALKDKVGHIYTTLGLKRSLIDLGYKGDQITELDWWEQAENDVLEITATPAQHFSGRGIFDRNQTLWASWVIKTADVSLFFSADSGYFDGFQQIGERFGPFDMTFMEDGAYNERWRSIHMMPEETIQAHLDLKGNWLFPIHNGSFKLSNHPWKEPFQRIDHAAKQNNVSAVFPKFGEVISVRKPTTSPTPWWQ